MLRRWSSQTPLVAGLVEHECPRCHHPVELPLGELCEACLKHIAKRARKAARLVATLSTLAVGLYVLIPFPTDERVRIVGLVGVLIWYTLSNIVVRRVMSQWQR